MEQWEEIRRRVLKEGVSRRQIARETGMHHSIIRKILTHSIPPDYRQSSPRSAPKLGPHIEWVKDILNSDKQVHKEQRHTARPTFGRLKTERGYDGGETVVKELVRELKRTSQEVYMPLSQPPGEAQGAPHLNEKVDRRMVRPALTLDELGLLLSAAEMGTIVHGMIGAHRALLYRTAVETGLRWSELRSLTRASFDFNSEQPTVTIAAAYAKNEKEETLPLRSELAEDMRRHLSLSLPDAPAFPGMWADKGAEMICEDLEAAGILHRDAEGELIIQDEYGLFYDFHSLRSTFATLLNKAKVPLATAQRLMRHSDPKLTANIYTHVLIEDKAEELAKLPQIRASSGHLENLKNGTTDVICRSASCECGRGLGVHTCPDKRGNYYHSHPLHNERGQ